MRGLQAEANQKSLLEHKEEWNPVNHVFEWLTTYTTDEIASRGMSSETKELHKVKARLAELTDNCIARVGTRGLS